MSCAELIINKLKEKYKGDTKLDVAFICYNASMWDSLGSVYLLVKDIWNVEIVCPYYIKGKELTTDIDYMSYDCSTTLKKDYYDIIFNNNPYDDNNYVTKLNKNYWNTNLAKICDTLVLVPYFCNSDEIDENIVLTNGFFVADLVIVDSEKVKQYCCETLHNFFLQFGQDYDFSGKIFAFGSPKYDAVIKDKKENYTIPTEWVNIISNRKIILFNTSLKPFLENSNKLEDIKYILNRFKNDPNYVIWWRPHPLLRETIINLRPEKLEEYDEIVEWVKESNCAIFDNTSDLHRSIAVSDLTITDKSSVAYLYEKTGKPITFMDEYIKNKNLNFSKKSVDK